MLNPSYSWNCCAVAAVPNDGIRVRMSKKIISLTLCFILVFGTFSNCYAISTDSAIKATKELKSSDLRANPPDGSSSNPYYINPQSSSGTRYYLNDSTNTVSSSSVYVTTWGDLMNHLTYSIAYSFKGVTSRLATLITNLSNYLNSTASSSYYYWDWTPTGGVQQGAPESAETIVQAVRNIGSQLSKSLAYGTEYTYQLYDYFVNGSGLTVDLGNPYQPYFMPDDNYDFNNNDWDYYYLRTVDEWGTVSSIYFTQPNILMGLKRLLVNINNNETYGFRNICRSVGGTANNSFVPKLYNIDLTTTDAEKLSLWRTIYQYGENTSMFLSRLAFVLASDEEIEARQEAADNQDAFIDNFISSNGSGRVSTTDLGDMASGSSAIKNALSSNADIDDALGIFNGDTSIWDWFTTETKNSFDNVSVARSSMDNYTHYVDNFYTEVLHGIHADINDDR